MMTKQELILEELEPALKKCLLSKKFEGFNGPERRCILTFLDQVRQAETPDLETRRKSFSLCRMNPGDESMEREMVNSHSRLLFEAIMDVTRNALSFDYLKRKRKGIVLEDFHALILHGKYSITLYAKFYDEYDEARLYGYLCDVVKMMIGRFYNALGINYRHNLKASYLYDGAVISLKNNYLFAWKDVYVEVWCVDVERRPSEGIGHAVPPIVYPVCMNIPMIRPRESRQIVVAEKITGDVRTNQVSAICLWCRKQGRIGFHKALNNLFMKVPESGDPSDTNDPPRGYPVLIADFDRHLEGWPTIFP